MKFYEVLAMLDKDPALVMYRTGWNGIQSGRKMRVSVQRPDEHSANTEPYFYMESVVAEKEGPRNARCPWVPSMLDFFATDWVAQY